MRTLYSDCQYCCLQMFVLPLCGHTAFFSSVKRFTGRGLCVSWIPFETIFCSLDTSHPRFVSLYCPWACNAPCSPTCEEEAAASLSPSDTGTALLGTRERLGDKQASGTSDAPDKPTVETRRLDPYSAVSADTFSLICKAYTVIHLWCYGGKKRFMTHNKLLRSCMWWGNQGRKWGGNSLLHATLIHPSVRETSPLCTPHLKGPEDDDCRSTVRWSQVCSEVSAGPPRSIWTLRRLPQPLDPWRVDNIAAWAKTVRCSNMHHASVWAEEGDLLHTPRVLYQPDLDSSDKEHSVNLCFIRNIDNVFLIGQYDQ